MSAPANSDDASSPALTAATVAESAGGIEELTRKHTGPLCDSEFASAILALVSETDHVDATRFDASVRRLDAARAALSLPDETLEVVVHGGDGPTVTAEIVRSFHDRTEEGRATLVVTDRELTSGCRSLMEIRPEIAVIKLPAEIRPVERAFGWP